MKNIHVIVRDKIAVCPQRDAYIVCMNKVNEDEDSGYQIVFRFDAEWDKYTKKTARFVWNGEYFDKKFEGNVCPVPVITGTDVVEVGVYAGDLSTTTSAEIPCKESVLCKTSKPSDGAIKEYRDEAAKFADRAEESAENAAESAENAKASADDSARSASGAASSAVAAARAAAALENFSLVLSTGDKTDRWAELQEILNSSKYLELGAGDFYISKQLQIGNGAILTGCGAATRIMQTPDSTQPSMIWLKSEGTIKNVCLQGEWTEKPTEDTPYTARRIGIVTSQGTHNAMISNCFIRGWTGQGILCDDNYMSTFSILISDCDICMNNIGLRILEKNEYACVSHCVFHNNIYAVQNNGGNNKFTACGFDSNIYGFVIADGYNNGHGAAVGCTFNHNSKYAIRIDDNEIGYVFSSCNFAEGIIRIGETTRGTLFAGCRFGNWMSYRNYAKTPTMFSGCIFSHSPQTESTEYLDEYGGFKFVGCINYNTGKSVDNVTETWTFTVENDDGSTTEVQKAVYAG